jgi:hypothetical protein
MAEGFAPGHNQILTRLGAPRVEACKYEIKISNLKSAQLLGLLMAEARKYIF